MNNNKTNTFTSSNMNSEQFCYWLQGFFELSGNKELTKEQLEVIKEHLGLVFNKVTTKTVATTKEEAKNILKKIVPLTTDTACMLTTRYC